MKFPWFALRYFIFIVVCLFKVFMKMLRGCWYLILFMSYFNISLSSSALNSSFRKFMEPLQFTIFGFGFGKYCFKIVVVSLWKSEIPVSNTLLSWKLRRESFRIRSIHYALPGFLKHVFCFTKLFRLHTLKRSEIIFI